MITTVRAVYENGVLRPKEPLPPEIQEGQEVDVQIRVAESYERRQMQALLELIQEWKAHPEEVFADEGEWEEFHAFLQENRLNFPERDLGLPDE